MALTAVRAARLARRAGRGEVVVLGRDGGPRRISIAAQGPGAEPHELSGQVGPCLFGTADGRHHALGGDGFALIASPCGRLELGTGRRLDYAGNPAATTGHGTRALLGRGNVDYIGALALADGGPGC